MQFRTIFRHFLIWTLIIQLGFVLPTIAMAQSYSEGRVNATPPHAQKVGDSGQYYLNEYNELLIRVNIWGQVRSPGQYFVPATTDLITLMSIAGGPEYRSRLSNITVVRESETGENEVIEVNVKKYLKTGDKRLIPDLEPEDTVVVHGSAWQMVADVVKVVSELGIVATVYYYFFVAER